MSSIEKNIAQFSQRYNFEKRNYNIIIYSPDATGKYDFIFEIYTKFELPGYVVWYFDENYDEL